MIPLDADTVKVSLITAGAVLLSGLIGAGAVLIGVNLTGRNALESSRSAHELDRKLHNEQIKREAYAGLLRQLDGILWTLQQMLNLPEAVLKEEAGKTLDEQVREFDAAETIVKIVGARALSDIAVEMAAVIGDKVHGRSAADPVFHDGASQLISLYRRFVDAARADLGADLE